MIDNSGKMENFNMYFVNFLIFYYCCMRVDKNIHIVSSSTIV